MAGSSNQETKKFHLALFISFLLIVVAVESRQIGSKLAYLKLWIFEQWQIQNLNLIGSIFKSFDCVIYRTLEIMSL